MQTEACCCHDDVFPEHLRPPASPDSRPRVTKPTPQQSPFTSTSPSTSTAVAPQYPTHFPSTWFLGNWSIESPAGGFEQRRTQSCPHMKNAAPRPSSASLLRHVSPAPQASAGTCHPSQRSVSRPELLHHEEGGPEAQGRAARVAKRQQTITHPHDLCATMDMDDVIMRELKGPLSRQEEIDRWMQSQSHVLPRPSSCTGSLHSWTSNNGLWWARERHPSEFSDVSDGSGLGDAPHKGLDIPDTYSVYATSM
ncbi:hypothetical protein K458DRAFT_422934 [Lentithecium fluviatile CBS 122367]|uniref:Uncharacterized protein n=1 Tax=Lentithecium fluviatile CBS 122367 TaxID=1168545 RepID=A0A6G1IKS7_9PLEO|nr:hypothetical protein K458DRAFT_422934 [Lentithecium fluviatile CBS 122367]